MRISNFAETLGGATNLVADQIVNGAARNIQLTINQPRTDPVATNVPQDLTGYTLEFDTIQGSAGNLTPGRDGGFVVNDITLDATATPISRDANATIADAAAGIINIYIPNDYYTGDVNIDSNTNVPCVIGNLRYTDASATNPIVNVVRVLHFIRYGVIAP